MTTNKIMIGLGSDVQEAIKLLDSARVRICFATVCKNHRQWMRHDDLGCNLRDVQLTEDGRCESFERDPRAPRAE